MSTTSNYDNWEYHMLVECVVGWTCVCKLGAGGACGNVSEVESRKVHLSVRINTPFARGGGVRPLFCERLNGFLLFLLPVFPSACQTRSSLPRSSQFSYHDHDISFWSGLVRVTGRFKAMPGSRFNTRGIWLGMYYRKRKTSLHFLSGYTATTLLPSV